MTSKYLPPLQKQVLGMIPKAVRSRQVSSKIEKLASFFTRRGCTVAVVALAAVHLTKEVEDNMGLWWSNKITGARCVKNVVDSFVTVGAGMGGGAVGATLGFAVGGPLGALVFGLVGGLMAEKVAGELCKRLTQLIFGVPTEVALENAYAFLGVKMTASNQAINSAYRKLCLRHHPDKEGGNAEMFLLLQMHMTTIKLARGESGGGL